MADMVLPPLEQADQQSDELKLAGDFPAATRAEWRELAAAMLARSGTPPTGDVEELLSSTTYGGISIKPLYTADDLPGIARSPAMPGRRSQSATAGWDVRGRHAHPDPQVTQQAVLADLENG